MNMPESEEVSQVQEISSDEEMMRPDITDVISISDDSYSTGSDYTESDYSESDYTESDDTEYMER